MKVRLKSVMVGLLAVMTVSTSVAAHTLELPESTKEPNIVETPVGVSLQEASEASILGWDFESEESQKEAIWGAEKGSGAAFEYRYGMLRFSLEGCKNNVEFVSSAASAALNGISVNKENGKYLVVRLRNNSNCTKMQFWYQTENMSSWNGDTCAFSVNLASESSDFITYAIDLSGWSNWKSGENYKTSRLVFIASEASPVTGSIDVEEVYFSDTYPENNEAYFGAYNQKLGAFTAADGISISCARMDTWASEVTKNADGSLTIKGASGYSGQHNLVFTPTHTVDIGTYKYLVLKCSKESGNPELGMILCQTESGTKDTWAVNSNYVESVIIGNYKYYLFKLQPFTGLTGSIKKLQMFANQINVTIYDAYWTKAYTNPQLSVEKSYFNENAEKIDTLLGEVRLDGYIRYLDGHEGEVTYTVSPTDAAELVTHDGNTYLRALKNGTVTVTALVGDTVVGTKEVTMSGQNIATEPTTFDFSVRTDTVSGLRLRAGVSTALKQMKERDVEYGFLISRKWILDYLLCESTALTFTGLESEYYVRVPSYQFKDGALLLDESVEGSDANTTFIRCVLTDVPKTREAYTDVFVIRPYVCIDDIVCYGTPGEQSLYEAVKQMKPEQIEENEFLRSVIELVEEE